MGIDITGQVIIIDEAHNLIDAINNMYSVELTLPQVFLHL